MGTLLLNSLEIRGFRGFRHLQIERLGRVNLIVGKNNIGKSSLLEALLIYARRGTPTLIWEILGARDESRELPSLANREVEDRLLALKYLFYGRRDIKATLEPIQIGPINSPDETVSISVGWYTQKVDEDGRLQMQLIDPKNYDLVDNPIPRLRVQMGKKLNVSYSLNMSPASNLLRPEIKEINSVFIAANGMSRGQVSELWDNIALTGLEKEVLASLRIIAPGIEGLSIVGDSTSSVRERTVIVKIAGIDDLIPLRSLGDGMQRVLNIALALVNAKGGMLIVDEIENGLHYSVLSEIWDFIFRMAHRLDVQIFATTHRWDCIEVFQEAAQEDKQNEGLLIRLESKKGEIVATLFDEEELGIVTRQQIEVR